MRKPWFVAIVMAATVSAAFADDPPATPIRKSGLSDEDLRKQLQLIPELGFDQSAAFVLYNPLTAAAKKNNAPLPPFDYGPRAYAQLAANLKRPTINYLPWITGQDAQLGKEAAERLDVLSSNLRRYLRESSTRDDPRPNVEKLSALIAASRKSRSSRASLEWDTPEALPALLQLLQAENTPIRILLIDLIAKIPGKQATIALAQRSLFDLSANVRDKAIAALASRDKANYQPIFLEAFNYPWPPVADHAAESLIALKAKETIPHLIKALKNPNPALPFQAGTKTHFVRELIKINHMCNCMLCHAPSTAKTDNVRGRIPIPGEEPPPLYYQETSGIFVRADVTYLRQDFSVHQPVLNPVKWPGNQRFDYFIRTRQATTTELKKFTAMPDDYKTDHSQHYAALFALKKLTNLDYGRDYSAWTPLLKSLDKTAPK